MWPNWSFARAGFLSEGVGLGRVHTGRAIVSDLLELCGRYSHQQGHVPENGEPYRNLIVLGELWAE